MDDSIGWLDNIRLSSTCNDTIGSSCLGLLELAARVGVSDAVLVLVRLWRSFHRSVVHWGLVRGGCVGYHWCSVHHRGSVHQRRMVHWRMVDWCMVNRGMVDWTGMVQRGMVNAMVAATVPLNSVAVLCPLLHLLLPHLTLWSVVRHGSPLQIQVEGVKGVLLVTHLVSAMSSFLLLLLLTSNNPKEKNRNAGLLMKLGQ